MDHLSVWNELSRKEQRILIKLFGGGSVRSDLPIATANLVQLGFINEGRLSSGGLALFLAALSAQQQHRKRKLLG